MSYRIVRRIHRFPTSKAFITGAERNCFCIMFLLLVFLVIILPTLVIYLSLRAANGNCSHSLGYYKRKAPVTALLSPPGCGGDWVSYVLQQISGYHVGSIYDRTGKSNTKLL